MTVAKANETKAKTDETNVKTIAALANVDMTSREKAMAMAQMQGGPAMPMQGGPPSGQVR